MNSRGYTLLEVSLFLAISGALTLVAILGLAPRLTNVRFSTAMRGLQDNVSKQLSSAQEGKSNSTSRLSCTASGDALNVSRITNPDPDTVVDSSSCVYVGKIAVFNNAASEVEYRSIISLRESVNGCSETDNLESIKQCYRARILEDDLDSVSSYSYSGGIQQESEDRAYGFVRSPDSNIIHRFSIKDSSQTSPYSGVMLSDNSRLTYDEFKGAPVTEVPVCFSLSNRIAAIVFSTKSDQSKLVFNEELC